MSSVDDRVVNMQFNNKQFETGVKTTLDSLDLLNKSLKMEGATKGLGDLDAAAKKVSLAHIAAGVDSIASKFQAMSIIAITALSNITTQALHAGSQLVKSLTIDPIRAGLEEYETNLNSIQTILSNTQWQHTGLDDVNDALQQLNHYSDMTIYSFSEMARNIGTFTAAGVKLQTSVDAIKGIANLAAISGSNSQQAATAMYQLSQALATGTVKLMDWNSVVNAGMGGKVFQDALKETARVHGVAVDKIIKDEGSFRDSLHKGWLTSEILTETLAKFTGDLTAKQLKAMGYNNQQIAGILKMGKTAQDAATKVKTFSQLINTLQEAAGSGWSQTWQMIFGDFEEAKSLFSGVYNVLGGFITASANARNKVLGDWKELGGRTSIITSISNAFNALISVLTPVRDAFRQIFPRTTGKQLFEITLAIQRFSDNLKLTWVASENLRKTFAGLFAAVDIVWMVAKEVLKTLFSLFGAVTDGAGSFLSVTAKIGDFVVGLRDAIKHGDGLTKFFDGLRAAIQVPVKFLLALASALATAFGGVEGGAKGAETALSNLGDRVSSRFSGFAALGQKILDVWNKVTSMFKKTGGESDGLSKKLSDLTDTITEKLKEVFGNVKFDSVLDALNTGLFAALVLVIRRFLKNGLVFQGILNLGGSGGFVDSIKKSFDQLTNTMKAMQSQLKANALIKIAGAIALLTASLVAISLINSDKLTGALVAISTMFAELSAVAVVLDKFASSAGLLKMPFITAALILLAVAMDVLSIAVAKLAKLDWDSLVRGLTGVGVAMAIMVGAVYALPDDKKLITTSAGLIVLAGAVRLLVESVTTLAGLSWEQTAKGLIGVGAILTGLALFTKFANVGKGAIASSASVILLAVGVKMLADSVVEIAQLSWDKIAKGLLGLVGAIGIVVGSLELLPPTAVLGGAGMLIVGLSLSASAETLERLGGLSWQVIIRGLTALLGAVGIMALAVGLLPPTAPLGAAAIALVAVALEKIIDPFTALGQMSWGAIGKATVALLSALTLIAAGTTVMLAALPGAAAMVVVVGALALLVPVLKGLGSLDWGVLGKAFLVLAGLFTLLGVAGAVIAPVVPALLGLAGAIALLGIGLVSAGLGVLAFSAALTALALIGDKGADAIVSFVKKMVGLIPMVMTELANGVVAFAGVIKNAGPQIKEAITTVLTSFLDTITEMAPKIIDTLFKLMAKLLETLLKYVGPMTDAGLKILVAFLKGVANNIGQVATSATDVMIAFLKVFGNNQARLVDAGFKTIIDFINGVTKAVDKNSTALGKAGGDLAVAIIKGMVKGIAAGIGQVKDAAVDMAKAALNAAKNFLGIHSPSKAFEEEVGEQSGAGAAKGLYNSIPVVNDAAESVANSALETMKKSMATASKIAVAQIDATPRIRPVLDLSDIQAKAAQIPGMLPNQPLAVGSYSGAVHARLGYQTNLDLQAAIDADRLRPDLVYNQYNTSPKALSSADIYRQTKNQLSTVKGALAKA